MPRVLRECPGGLCYHVMNRSVGRIKLFRGEGDYLAFERVVAEALERVPVPLLAYCVMPTHFHLVLRPEGDGDVTRLMHWLTLTHAQRWRHAHNTVSFGPLYQGRFKSFVIEEDSHLVTVLRYVERNALRAGLVRRAEDWRWCSLARRESGGGSVAIPLADWNVVVRPDWVRFVNEILSGEEEQALRLSIQRGRPFGTPDFQEKMTRQLKLQSAYRDPGRPSKKPAVTV